MTCGMQVAPRIPTASSTLSVPSKPGTNRPCAIPDAEGWASEDLEAEGDHDHADERGDHDLELAEAAALERQDQERRRRR